MSTSSQPQDRRHASSAFEHEVMRRLGEGEKVFENLGTDIGDIKQSLLKLHQDLKENNTQTELSVKLSKEAIDISQKALEKAETTASNTEDLVAIQKFGKAAVNGIASGAKATNVVTKFIVRFMVIGTIAAALWHGKLPDWKTIFEALK